MIGRSGLKICYVRIAQVCILLEMIHPTLEKFATPVESFEISKCGQSDIHIAEIELKPMRNQSCLPTNRL